MSSAEQPGAELASLIERLLTDPAFRAAFMRDPATACHQFGLHALADELGGGGKAMEPLELRESKSSLAGAVMAIAAEGMGAAELSGLIEHGVLHGGRALHAPSSALRHQLHSARSSLGSPAGVERQVAGAGSPGMTQQAAAEQAAAPVSGNPEAAGGAAGNAAAAPAVDASSAAAPGAVQAQDAASTVLPGQAPAGAAVSASTVAPGQVPGVAGGAASGHAGWPVGVEQPEGAPGGSAAGAGGHAGWPVGVETVRRRAGGICGGSGRIARRCDWGIARAIGSDAVGGAREPSRGDAR